MNFTFREDDLVLLELSTRGLAIAENSTSTTVRTEKAATTTKSIAIPKNVTLKTVATTKDFTKNIEVTTCHGNRYGDNCTQACPTNCGGDGSCDKVTGECTSGCAPGYFRGKCDEECVNCVEKTCHQKTRKCIVGCMPGFSGVSCTKAETTESNTVMYIILACFLLLLLVMLLFVAFKYKRHRNRVVTDRETRFIERADGNMDDLNFLVARLSQFQSPPPRKVKQAPQGGESEESEDDSEDV